jgi:hypothetical protein
MADPDMANAAQAAALGGILGPAGAAVAAGALSVQSMNVAKGEVQKLADAANSGGFAISENGADAYIKVFRDFEDALTGVQGKLHTAGQAPKLGGSDYAQSVASQTKLMATGDDQSFDAALTSLKDIVGTARQAFEKAKTMYTQIDDDHVQVFGSAKAQA